jgi:formylglycine-generating enzyme required for sulfatase activity
MREFLIPLHFENFCRFKSFIHFIMNLVIFCFAQKALSSNSCNAIYSVQRSNAEVMALLDPKLQTSLRTLAELHLSTELMKQKNPDSIVAVSLNDAYQKKYHQHLDYFLNNKIMNEDEMTSIMREYILEKQGRLKRDKDQENERKRIERREIIKNPFIDGTRAVMHRIEPGSFKMGEITVDANGVINRSKQVDVTITKPFDMMATPTTQIIWKKIAELAAQKLPGKYQIDADPSPRKGDTLPVEKVSYEDIQTWLNALNELSVAGDPDLQNLIPDHKQGDVYRLPTEAEWEFVVRGRGQYNDLHHFGNQEALISEYSWILAMLSQPVGQKKPLVIDGKEFYDMIGNVWQWVHDRYQKNLLGGIDPQGPTGEGWLDSWNVGVLRGGSTHDYTERLRSALRIEYGFKDRSECIGFRFVRAESIKANSSRTDSQQKSFKNNQAINQGSKQSAQKPKQNIFNKFKSFFGQRSYEQDHE